MLDELERLEQGATPGLMNVEWDDESNDPRPSWIVIPVAPARQYPLAWTGGGRQGEADARYIAAACNALPALLRVARAAREVARTDNEYGYDSRLFELAMEELEAAVYELEATRDGGEA